MLHQMADVHRAMRFEEDQDEVPWCLIEPIAVLINPITWPLGRAREALRIEIITVAGGWVSVPILIERAACAE